MSWKYGTSVALRHVGMYQVSYLLQEADDFHAMSRWLYLALFAASCPYFITFLQMGIKILFGNHQRPTLWTLLWVSVPTSQGQSNDNLLAQA